MNDRDLIATAAMPIFLRHALSIVDGYSPQIVALQAYRLADAMMRERAATLPGRQAADGCVDGYKAHRWNPVELTCFRCGASAPEVQVHRARKLLGSEVRPRRFAVVK